MEGKKRPTFDQKWWDEISNYLKEHPEEGFEEDEVKQFMKFVVNKYMNSESNVDQLQQLEKLRKQVNEKLEDVQ
jgi:cell division septum initiation protein DivIVA